MSTTTTNYGLVKPELTDAADITAMNENWDKIDEELKEHADHTHTASDVGARPDTWMPTASQVGALSDKGGTLSGNLKLLRGNSPTIEMKVLSDNGYTSMYQHGGTFTTSSGMSSDSDESFMVLTKPSEDDDSSIFRIGRTINNSSKYYKLYGEHNKPTASDVGALPITGGTIEGTLYLDRSEGEQGKTSIYKHNTATADYGTKLRDVDADGDTLTLNLQAKNDKCFLIRVKSGGSEEQYNIYSDLNKPTATVYDLPITDSVEFTDYGFARYWKTITGEIGISIHVRATAVLPTGTVIANLPSGFRPTLRHEIPLLIRDVTEQAWTLAVTKDGAITLYAIDNETLASARELVVNATVI